MNGYGTIRPICLDSKATRDAVDAAQSDIIDHAARIKADYTALLAAMRKLGWKGCPDTCTCKGNGQ